MDVQMLTVFFFEVMDTLIFRSFLCRVFDNGVRHRSFYVLFEQLTWCEVVSVLAGVSCRQAGTTWTDISPRGSAREILSVWCA